MIAYTRHDGETSGSLTAVLVELYAAVYAEPPYREGPEQVERFRDSFAGERGQPGFSLVTATDGEMLAGVAYGWTMAAGTWWSGADREAPDHVRDSPKLAVMEWMVAAGWRGRGIGGEVLRRLLDGRAETYATLASDPRSPARRIYERAGWRPVGQTTLAWGPVMDLLILER